MKKLIIAFIIALAFNACIVKADAVNSANTAAPENSTTAASPAISDSDVQQMISRVYEIEKMDKSNLNADQKEQLKKELITMKDKMEERRPHVVFVFTGLGIIILIILLIVLL
jgi:hypothetical protein